jgi:uncharacterized protein YciI
MRAPLLRHLFGRAARLRSFTLALALASLGPSGPSLAAEPAPPLAAPPPNMESYQLVFLRRGPSWTKESSPAIEKLQAEHLGHLRKMGESGKLLVAGPLSDQPDEGLRGICIYRAGSLAQARALAEADPMVKAGRLRVEVMTWWVEKGALAFPMAVPPR